jgi:hypothetical protein
MFRKAILTITIFVLALGSGLAQTQKSGSARGRSDATTTIQPFATSAVSGSGTQGRIPKWTNSSTLNDSNIFEDKLGSIGIGTTSPTSTLTVQGMVEITLGGLKFPDGSVQTSAGSGINHDQTLKGDGSAASPLGLAVPLIFTGSVDNGNGVITVTNVAAGAPGIFAVGGNSSPTVGGGSGLISLGGSGNSAPGGAGLVSFGGNASAGSGGTGGSLIGGVGSNTGNGGDGLFAVGALGTGAGKKGGRGIVAIAGGGASGATSGLAGDFVGDVNISGNLSKGGGSFKIDHPLDPENKFLYHSFVESPDMMNIYNGNITTDENGEASVQLPDWFGALNRDYRYQLTTIGVFAQAIVSEKIKGNRFVIRTSTPNVEVSWQVTGIRKDAYAEKHRIPVEEMKREEERGYYLHPDAFNQPEEKNIINVSDPGFLQMINESRARAVQEAQQKEKTKNR